jgi:hypothetical protein
MKELQAIAIVSNVIYTMENTFKYREEHGDKIRIEEYMLPEALHVILDLAKKNNVAKIVDEIIGKDK